MTVETPKTPQKGTQTLPCPFCGGPGEDDWDDSNIGAVYFVRCERCGARGPWAQERTEGRRLWEEMSRGKRDFIALDSDGTVDDVAIRCDLFRAEMLDTDCLWIAAYRGQERVCFVVTAEKGRLRFEVTEDDLCINAPDGAGGGQQMTASRPMTRRQWRTRWSGSCFSRTLRRCVWIR